MNTGTKTARFFCRESDSPYAAWRLKVRTIYTPDRMAYYGKYGRLAYYHFKTSNLHPCFAPLKANGENHRSALTQSTNIFFLPLGKQRLQFQISNEAMIAFWKKTETCTEGLTVKIQSYQRSS